MDCKNNNDNCQVDLGRGCEFCNCDSESKATACEGCYKLHSLDWLAEYPDNFPGEIVEVRFKNTRKGYYQNAPGLTLKAGDIVAVEASPGHDIGIVSMTGDMVARQMRRVGFNPQNGEYRKVYRKAKPYDIEKWQEAIALEHQTMIRSRQIAADLRLNMKIGDVEYQGDKIKAIFYYIADERVDFRELIKIFADVFRIRIEMKQIGARQEAGRIGGLGSCGRELCCASWISGFLSITTNSARQQELSLNPQKLAGQCGKLKCCLIYELDSYLDARKDLPRVHNPLQVLDGDYFLVKTDILRRTMSFSTSPNAMVGVVTLPVERVREVIEMNKRGKKPDRLESKEAVAAAAVAADPGFVNVIGEESITRFDKSREGGSRRRSRGGQSRGGGGNASAKPRGEQPSREEGGNKPRGEAGTKPRNDGGKPQGGNSNAGDGNRNRHRGGRNRGGKPREGGQGGGQPHGGGGQSQGGGQ